MNKWDLVGYLENVEVIYHPDFAEIKISLRKPFDIPISTLTKLSDLDLNKLLKVTFTPVAQLEERPATNGKVAGSRPARGTFNRNWFRG